MRREMEYGEEAERLLKENNLEAADELLRISKRREDYMNMREAVKMASRLFIRDLQPHISHIYRFRKALEEVFPKGISLCLAVLMGNWGNDRSMNLGDDDLERMVAAIRAAGMSVSVCSGAGSFPIQLNLAFYLGVLHADLNEGGDIFPGLNFPEKFQEIYTKFEKHDTDGNQVRNWYRR
ncbi:MAG: hypothetical protein GF334_03845 [Candidatus Altiarchaeales archaeon]|nr:hypothetical protein [Candidatus Altiarchaeales archaeon]